MPDNNTQDPRPNWSEYFFGIAEAVSKRASCPGAKVGVVIVDPRDNHILSTGYNGSAPGESHCFDIGCLKDPNIHDGHCRRVIHAEMNAIGHAARHGTELRGAHLYTFFDRGESKSYELSSKSENPIADFPCLKCGQLIMATGIKEAFVYSGSRVAMFHNVSS